MEWIHSLDCIKTLSDKNSEFSWVGNVVGLLLMYTLIMLCSELIQLWASMQQCLNTYEYNLSVSTHALAWSQHFFMRRCKLDCQIPNHASSAETERNTSRQIFFSHFAFLIENRRTRDKIQERCRTPRYTYILAIVGLRSTTNSQKKREEDDQNRQ